MKKILNILVIVLLFSSTMSYSSDRFVNDLNCEDYIDMGECKKLYELFKNEKIDNYHMATFDNQLKKISSLLKRNKDKIARKKYNYFFEILEDEVDEDKKEELYKSKEKMWDLIFNYSKSDDYINNPKYK